MKDVLVWAAIIKIAQTGWLNRNLFPTVLKAGQSKIRVPTWPGFCEGFFPGLQMAVIFLCPHKAEKSKRATLVSFSSDKDTNLIMEVPHSRPPLNLITSRRLLLIPSQVIRVSTFWGEGAGKMQCITKKKDTH